MTGIIGPGGNPLTETADAVLSRNPVYQGLVGPDGSTPAAQYARRSTFHPESLEDITDFVDTKKRWANAKISRLKYGINNRVQTAAFEIAMEYAEAAGTDIDHMDMDKIYGAEGHDEAKAKLAAVVETLFTVGGDYDPLKHLWTPEAMAGAPVEDVSMIRNMYLGYGDDFIEIVQSGTEFEASLEAYFSDGQYQKSPQMQAMRKPWLDAIGNSAEAAVKGATVQEGVLWESWMLDKYRKDLVGLPVKYWSLKELNPQLVKAEVMGQLDANGLKRALLAQGAETDNANVLRFEQGTGAEQMQEMVARLAEQNQRTREGPRPQ